jgi:hypothetical protein
VRGLATAAALLAAGPAFAQAETATFRVDGVAYTVAVPKGYCTPHGEDMAFAQAQARLDTDSTQHLMLLPCERAERDPNSFIIISTPTALIGRRIDRASIIDGIARNPGTPKAEERQMEQGLSTMAGEAVEIEAGLGPRGSDTVCAYVGGIIRYQSTRMKTVSLANGGCWTAVGNRALVINSYVTSDDPAMVKTLLSQVREMALTLSTRQVE